MWRGRIGYEVRLFDWNGSRCNGSIDEVYKKVVVSLRGGIIHRAGTIVQKPSSREIENPKPMDHKIRVATPAPPSFALFPPSRSRPIRKNTESRQGRVNERSRHRFDLISMKGTVSAVQVIRAPPLFQDRLHRDDTSCFLGPLPSNDWQVPIW